MQNLQKIKTDKFAEKMKLQLMRKEKFNQFKAAYLHSYHSSFFAKNPFLVA